MAMCEVQEEEEEKKKQKLDDMDEDACDDFFEWAKYYYDSDYHERSKWGDERSAISYWQDMIDPLYRPPSPPIDHRRRRQMEKPGPDDIRDLAEYLEGTGNIYVPSDHKDRKRFNKIYRMATREDRAKFDAIRYRNVLPKLLDMSLKLCEQHPHCFYPEGSIPLSKIMPNFDFNEWNNQFYKETMIATICPHYCLDNPYGHMTVHRDLNTGIPCGQPHSNFGGFCKYADEQRIKFRDELYSLYPKFPETKDQDKEFIQKAVELAQSDCYNLLTSEDVFDVAYEHTLAVDHHFILDNARKSLKKHVSELRHKEPPIIDGRPIRNVRDAYQLQESEVKDFIKELLRCKDTKTDEEIDKYLNRRYAKLDESFKSGCYTKTDYLKSKVAVAHAIGL